MPFTLLLAALLSYSTTTVAANCQIERDKINRYFNDRYQLPQLNQIRNKVRNSVTKSEEIEFIELQKKFNSIPHDTPDNQDIRIQLQKRARVLVRNAVSRAGYRILNPVEPSPFDALIIIKTSSDGYDDYSVELRSLLVTNDPLPHVTLWTHRQNPQHNPWRIITISLTNNDLLDTVSYQSEKTGERVIVLKTAFLKSKLPADCI